MNTTVENIGARRLHTVIERVVEDISYTAPDMEGGNDYVITADYVREKVTPLMQASDMRKYIL